jgi:hypothetical protein
MEYLLHEGRVLKLTRIKRGARVADTEQEWRARQGSAAVKTAAILQCTVVAMYIVYISIWPLSRVEELMYGDAITHAFITLALAWMGVSLSVYLRGVHRLPALPGVYENGIQFPGFGGVLMGNVFVPFDQIQGVKPVRIFGPPGTVWLDLGVKWYRVRMISWIFGREGIDAVRQAFVARNAPPIPEGPPRLVLYGP